MPFHLDKMKFTGSHLSLLFLTSSDLEPEDFLSEMDFTLKLTAIFAPWDASVSDVNIPTADELKTICTTADKCNMVIKTFRSESYNNISI